MVAEVEVWQLHPKTSPVISVADLVCLTVSRNTCFVLFYQNVHCCSTSIALYLHYGRGQRAYTIGTYRDFHLQRVSLESWVRSIWVYCLEFKGAMVTLKGTIALAHVTKNSWQDLAALKTLCYLKVLQNKLDGVSWLAALVQLMVHLVKLSFWFLLALTQENGNFRSGSAFILPTPCRKAPLAFSMLTTENLVLGPLFKGH